MNETTSFSRAGVKRSVLKHWHPAFATSEADRLTRVADMQRRQEKVVAASDAAMKARTRRAAHAHYSTIERRKHVTVSDPFEGLS